MDYHRQLGEGLRLQVATLNLFLIYCTTVRYLVSKMHLEVLERRSAVKSFGSLVEDQSLVLGTQIGCNHL